MAKNQRPAGNTVAIVEQLAAPIAQEMGLRLWDVRFEKEGPDWFLRIFIENPNALLDTDTCEAFSRAIDPLLDEADPIEQSYYLEVGSPGLGRKLTRPEHLTACVGEKIALRLIRADESGNREYEGILKSAEGSEFVLETEAGEKTFNLSAAGFVKLCDDEDLF